MIYGLGGLDFQICVQTSMPVGDSKLERFADRKSFNVKLIIVATRSDTAALLNCSVIRT